MALRSAVPRSSSSCWNLERVRERSVILAARPESDISSRIRRARQRIWS